MASEIPQLEVITAISEVETEDFVAQLLFSQGWNIIHRAIDFTGLISVLTARHDFLRTVVIYSSDLTGFDIKQISEFEHNNPSFSFVCIDGVTINSHLVMTHIRNKLRIPLLNQNTNVIKIEKQVFQATQKQKLVTITGTSGSPGRSHLTLLLASYLSWRTSVHVVDADLRSPSLAYLSKTISQNVERYSITTLEIESKPVSLPESERRELTVVDIGALPPLREVVTDRRWHAALINDILEQSSSLVYVTRSSGLGLLRLENFIAEFPILLRKIPIIYVLNQKSNSREDRAVESRFKSLTSGERAFVLPHDPRPISASRSRLPGIDLLVSGSKLVKEVDKIAQSIA